MAEWKEIYNDPEYKALPENDRLDIADKFYQTHFEKDKDFIGLNDADKSEIKNTFYSNAGFHLGGQDISPKLSYDIPKSPYENVSPVQQEQPLPKVHPYTKEQMPNMFTEASQVFSPTGGVSQGIAEQAKKITPDKISEYAPAIGAMAGGAIGLALGTSVEPGFGTIGGAKAGSIIGAAGGKLIQQGYQAATGSENVPKTGGEAVKGVAIDTALQGMFESLGPSLRYANDTKLGKWGKEQLINGIAGAANLTPSYVKQAFDDWELFKTAMSKEELSKMWDNVLSKHGVNYNMEGNKSAFGKVAPGSSENATDNLVNQTFGAMEESKKFRPTEVARPNIRENLQAYAKTKTTPNITRSSKELFEEPVINPLEEYGAEKQGYNVMRRGEPKSLLSRQASEYEQKGTWLKNFKQQVSESGGKMSNKQSRDAINAWKDQASALSKEPLYTYPIPPEIAQEQAQIVDSAKKAIGMYEEVKKEAVKQDVRLRAKLMKDANQKALTMRQILSEKMSDYTIPPSTRASYGRYLDGIEKYLIDNGFQDVKNVIIEQRKRYVKDALSNLFPQNKYGGAAKIKMIAMMLAPKEGILMSPLFWQGMIRGAGEISGSKGFQTAARALPTMAFDKQKKLNEMK